MKLLTLLENSSYHKVDRPTYTVDVHLQADRGDVTTFTSYVEVSVKDYNSVVSDLPSTMRDILNDVYSVTVANYPKDDKGHIGLRQFTIMDHLNGGGNSIFIGNINYLSRISRIILIGIEEPEEDIEEVVSSLYSISFPSYEECMTRLKNMSTLVQMATKMYDVKDINMELRLTPSINTISNVILNSTPEGMDEEQLGLKLAKLLKPYGVRPQINGGPIIGSGS